jgi:hypothetical protein
LQKIRKFGSIATPTHVENKANNQIIIDYESVLIKNNQKNQKFIDNSD